MDVIKHSKALIRQLKNVTLVELERETECCGFGGTFAVKQPAISAAMVKDKVADIANRCLDGDRRRLRLPDEHHRRHGAYRGGRCRQAPGRIPVGENPCISKHFDFADNIAGALGDDQLRRNLRNAMDILVDKRRAVFRMPVRSSNCVRPAMPSSAGR
jgi:hypothetical protein